MGCFNRITHKKILRVTNKDKKLTLLTPQGEITLQEQDLKKGLKWKHVNVLYYNQLTKLEEDVFLTLLDTVVNMYLRDFLIDAYYKTLNGYINYIKITSPKLRKYKDIIHLAKIYQKLQKDNQVVNHELII